MREFTESNGITVYPCDIGHSTEPFIGVSSEAMTNALLHAVDSRNHPLLIHCTKGKHSTGCVIGCLRKLQNWSLASIFDEYARFAGTSVSLLDQQFIEFYEIDDVDSAEAMGDEVGDRDR